MQRQRIIIYRSTFFHGGTIKWKPNIWVSSKAIFSSELKSWRSSAKSAGAPVTILRKRSWSAWPTWWPSNIWLTITELGNTSGRDLQSLFPSPLLEPTPVYFEPVCSKEQCGVFFSHISRVSYIHLDKTGPGIHSRQRARRQCMGRSRRACSGKSPHPLKSSTGLKTLLD